MLAVAATGTGMAAMSGLVLSFSLDITGLLSWVIRQWSETESAMARDPRGPRASCALAAPGWAKADIETISRSPAVARPVSRPFPQVSVERVSEYAALPPEEETGAVVHGGGAETAYGWPNSGALRVDNLSLRYQPAMPLVLNLVTFDVRSGEKVGLVGRTGSGKSTMLTALWRIVEPEHGSIWCVHTRCAIRPCRWPYSSSGCGLRVPPPLLAAAGLTASTRSGSS
jgi:ABC-type multidrug transport system fused ATPase/permease subunit